MRKQSLFILVNIIALGVTIAVNALANILPLNGQTTGEISNRFASYIVPAGFTFSIWSVIYVGLTVFAAVQALPGWRDRALVRSVGSLFLATCVANTAWIVLWHYEYYLATLLVMLVLLATLLAIYLRLDAVRDSATPGERLAVAVPFSLYLGWITIATIANATVVLLALGWSGAGIAPEVWAAGLVVVAAGIVGAIALMRVDIAYTSVGVWAFAGVAAGQWATPIVAWTAVAAAAWSIVALVIGWRRQRAGQPLRPLPA
jgi:hypothetical protein